MHSKAFFFFLLFLPVFFATDSKSSSNKPQLKFEPFRRTEQYRCGQFIEQSINDPAMQLLHRVNNLFIRKLSQPFPHEKLLSSDALTGNLNAWKESFVEHHDTWLDFERYWVIACAVAILLPVVFTFLYFLYRCCVCCCCSDEDGAEKLDRTDRRFDSCKRALLNALIAFFVVANVFCAVVLLISIQYTQYGLEELPTRLHYCANDFNIYRSETNDRLKKLLRDDFYVLNNSLHLAFDTAGDSVLAKLKQATGANLIDELVDKTNEADSIRKRFADTAKDLPQVFRGEAQVRTKLLRLNEAENALHSCERTSSVGAKAAICFSARQTIQQLIPGESKGRGDILSEQKQQGEIAILLPEEVQPALAQVSELDVEAKFSTAIEGMRVLRQSIQEQVDQRREDAEERLKLLDNTLFRLYEDISATIKSVDLRFLDDQIVDPMMRYREVYRSYVHYGWIGALVLAGIFAFIALTFFLGLFYGCCGRRPNDFDDDDCCVRSTGSNFFSCGVWLCLTFMAMFGVLTAAMMFLGANTAWLVCHPLQYPLSRPDMLSLVDRLIEVYGLDGSRNPRSHSQNPNPFEIDEIFTPTRRPIDLIRGCARGQTLYTMFGLDKKFKLLGDGGPIDEYENLVDSIRQSMRVLQVDQRMLRQNARDLQLYSGEMIGTLERLGRIQIPTMNATAIEEFCSRRALFQIEPVLAELRKLQLKADDEKQGSWNGEIADLDNLVRFLEELRPETAQLQRQFDSACTRLHQLRHDLQTLQFNETALIAQLETTNSQLNADHLNSKLRDAAEAVAVELAEQIKQYAQHINRTMATEVSSCTPIAGIARNSRAAVCDYTLEQFNIMWMAMGVGLLLWIPIILLTRSLTRLYNRTHPYTHYSVTESPNEATFATDIYGFGPNGGEGIRSRHATQQQPLKISHPLQNTSGVSPYATPSGIGGGAGNYGNYNNYELYPPPYISSSSRR